MLTTFPEKIMEALELARLSSTSKIFQTFVHGLTLPFLKEMEFIDADRHTHSTFFPQAG